MTQVKELSATSEPRLPAADPVEIFRTSPQQERLGLLRQAFPGAASYFVAAAVDLQGPISAAALEEALAAVAERHEILRTEVRPETFEGGSGQAIAGAPVALRVAAAGPEAARQDRPALWEAFLDRCRRQLAPASGATFRSLLVGRSPATHHWFLAVAAECADAATLRLLVSETLREVAGLAPREDEPLQYADFAEWQWELLESEDTEAGQAYWRVQDLGEEQDWGSLLEGGAGGGAQEPRRLHRLLAASPRRALLRPSPGKARTREILAAAWAATLARLSGRRRLVLGCAFPGRRFEELKSGFGLYSSFVPVTFEIAPGSPFGSFADGVAGELSSAAKWQEYFRWGSGGGAFAVGFEFESWPSPAPAGPGAVAWRPRHLELRTDVFQLKLAAHELAGEEIEVVLSYDPAVVGETRGEAILDVFEGFLEAALRAPETHLGQIPILTPEAYENLVHRLNHRRSRGSRDSLLERFAARVAGAPDAAAVEAGDVSWTYRDLDRRSNGVARRLGDLGLGREARVGILLRRSPEQIAGLLGVLKAGAAYLPLDPDHPAERIAGLLEDAAAAAVVTGGSLGDLVPEGVEALPIEDLEPAEAFPPRPVFPEQAAYVLYTSGSTGKPKGVVVPHGALATFLEEAVEAYGFSPADRVLQFATLTFDTSVEEILGALTSGACLVLRNPRTLDSMEVFLEQVAAAGVTVLDLPTALWHDLAAFLDEAGASLPPAVRQVVIGGEKALRRPFEAWRRRVPRKVRLANTYGPTEGTVVATCHEMDAPEASDPPIGRPMDHVRAYVADRALRLSPFGFGGELLLGGEALARGYFGRPALTAERFVPDPWAEEPGRRLYRTGDRVRYRRDEGLEFLGRTDHQVKIRGVRVELGEVESALRSVEGVKEGVVAPAQEASGAVGLVAYVVRQPGSRLTVESLRQALEGRLPQAMVPALFGFLDRLPRTRSGKIDRRALPDPAQLARSGSRGFVPPRNPEEGRMVRLWQQVLGLDQVGVFDDFFLLGGHSLKATQLMSRVQKEFGVSLPLAVLFEGSTVAELTERLAGAAAGGAGELFARRQAWIAEDAEGRRRLAMAVSVDGSLRPSLLREGLARMADGRDSLRGFPGLEIQDLRHREADGAREEARRRALDLAAANLGPDAPGLEAHLLRVGADEQALVPVLSPAAAGRWALEALLEELTGRLEARSQEAPEDLALLRRLAPRHRAFAVGEGPRPPATVWLSLASRAQVEVLGRALSETLRRRAVLRTRLASVEGQLRETVAEAAPAALTRVDLRALGAGAAEATARQLAALRGSDPAPAAEGGAVLQALALEVGDGEIRFGLFLDPLAADSWALGLWAEELAVLYGEASGPEGGAGPAPAPEGPAVGREQGAPGTLVRLRAGGSEPSLFLVPGAGGNLLSFSDLARQEGLGRPVFGFVARGLREGEQARSSVAEMAAAYGRELEGRVGDGPYLLGGWSMGALVALEMAARLQAGGRRPELLVLLDPPPPRSRRWRPATGQRHGLLDGFARELGFRLSDVVGRGSDLHGLDLETRLWMIYDRARSEGRLPEDLDFHQIQRFFDVYRSNSQALAEYRPSGDGFDGPVALFQASAGEPRTAAPWVSFLGSRLAVYSTPGDHHSMLRGPHAAALAGALETAAAQRDRKGNP